MSEPDRRRDFLNPLKAIRAFREEATEPEPLLANDLPNELEASHCLLYASRKAMACTFQVYFSPELGEEVMDPAVEALELLEDLENQMTVYRSSPMTYLNETAGQEPVRVESKLFRLLLLGKQLYEQTNGAFDMTSGLLTKAWGFYRKEGRVPEAEELQSVLDCVGTNQVEFQEDDETVAFRKTGLEINLGGIGKGYALDRMAEFLHEQGVSDYLIHGGQSSVLARGHRSTTNSAAASGSAKQEEQPGWKVGIRHPLQSEKRIAEIDLIDCALGTSGTGRQSFYHKGKRYGHIIDPQTGQPVEGVFSATAVAPSAAESDALATAFYVMGPERAVEFCEQHPRYGCLIVGKGKGQSVQLYEKNLGDQLTLLEK